MKLPTLLLVTNNSVVRIWMKQNTEKEFHIINAAKKEDAVETAKTARLDFVIVDAEFENYLALISELNRILRTLTPILLITGSLKKDFIDAALAAGVSDFLTTPLNKEELDLKIQAIRKAYVVRDKTQETGLKKIQENQ